MKLEHFITNTVQLLHAFMFSRWVAMECLLAVVEGCLHLEGCTSLACIQ